MEANSCGRLYYEQVGLGKLIPLFFPRTLSSFWLAQVTISLQLLNMRNVSKTNSVV
jgi:hypothetical protein